MGEAQGILDQGGSSAILDEETSEEDPKGGEETSHAGFRGNSFAEGRASGKAEHGRVHGGNAEEARSAGESRAWGEEARKLRGDAAPRCSEHSGFGPPRWPGRLTAQDTARAGALDRLRPGLSRPKFVLETSSIKDRKHTQTAPQIHVLSRVTLEPSLQREVRGFVSFLLFIS